MNSTVAGLRMVLGAGIVAAAIAAIGAQALSAGSESAGTARTPQVTVAASVTPDPVAPLDRVTVATTFRASATVPEPLRAKLEVRSASDGSSVVAMSQSGFSVPDQGARDVYWMWRVPVAVDPGEYTLHLQVTGADSGLVYGEADRAAVFRVQASR